MSMHTVIIKNSSGSAHTIEDLGIEIAHGTQVTLSGQYDYPDLAASDDLRALVNAGSLVVNDGTEDLSSARGELYLTIIHEDHLVQNFYSKSQLNTNGQSEVHWGNITNAPQFGAPHWDLPVLYRVTSIASGKAVGPATGDVCIDTDDQHYYKYNGATWDDLGAAVADARVINLSNATEDIYIFNGTNTWVEQTLSDDLDAVLVNDDGDGKSAQYIYESADNTWKKIGDVDYAGHFDGGASKHDANEIDVEGTAGYTYIAGTNVETALEDIDDELQNLNNTLGSQTLDQSYDTGGSGAGRVITADAGAVKIDTASSTNAALELTPKSNFPSTGLADGQLTIKDGILFVYDNTRSKWLSVDRKFIAFGRKGATRNQELKFFAGEITSNNSGIRIMRDATVVGMSLQFNESGTGTANLRRNDSATNVVGQTVTAAIGAHATNTNTDLNAGDFLQSYLAAASDVQDPMFILEIAWRG